MSPRNLLLYTPTSCTTSASLVKISSYLRLRTDRETIFIVMAGDDKFDIRDVLSEYCPWVLAASNLDLGSVNHAADAGIICRTVTGTDVDSVEVRCPNYFPLS
jgi:hypothetical protein